MGVLRRFVLVAAGAFVSTAGMAIAAPGAWASYASEPLPMQWTATGPVHASAVAGDTLYVGGLFDGTNSTGGVAALDADSGALKWEMSTNGDVRALAVTPDGNGLIAGGNFTTVNGATHRHLVELSTATGEINTAWKGRAGGIVRALLITGGDVYVGGTFATLDGVSNRGIGAVSVSDGTIDQSFAHFVDKNVWGLGLSGSHLIAVGNFNLVDNQTRRSAAMFDLANGAAMTSWAPPRVCSNCYSDWSVSTDATNAYIGTSGPGGYLGAVNLSTGHLAWWIHADGDIQAVSVGPDGLVYVGGHFGTYIGNASRTILAAVNPVDASVDPNFAPRLYTTYPGVWDISTTSTRLYAGGNFTGVRRNGANDHVPYLAAFGM